MHTWFLGADFQLHLLAYPFLVLYCWSEPLGVLANLVAILYGIMAPTVAIYRRGSPPTLSAFIEVLQSDFMDDMKHLYYPAYIHLSCYFVGVWLGWRLLKSQMNPENEKISNGMPKRFIWATMGILGLSMAAVHAAWLWNRPEGSLVKDPILGAIYFGSHRLVFILGPAWLVYICIRYPKSDFIITRDKTPRRKAERCERSTRPAQSSRAHNLARPSALARLCCTP